MVDEFLNSTEWVHRIKEVFALVDLNKNGYLELEDWELWVDNIQKEVNADPKLVDKLRDCVREYCTGMGLARGRRATL